MGIDRAKVRLGDAVLVCGAGPIGIISALCIRAAGAEPLMITDIDQGRLDFTNSTIPGIRTILVSEGQLPEELGQAIIDLANMKPIVTLECTGVESSFTAGIFSLEIGGVIYVIGVGSDQQNLPFMHLSVNEIDVLLIVDVIYEWARDVFRFEILCCLAGGKDDLRLQHLSSTATYARRFSTQEPPFHREMVTRNDSGVPVSAGASETPEIVDLTESASIGDLQLEDTMMEYIPKPSGNEADNHDASRSVSSHPLLRRADQLPNQAL